MELRLGPFDPALHVRSRDHYEAVRREAQLLELGTESVPRQLDELLGRLTEQFAPSSVNEEADRAFLAGEPVFTATMTVPDALVPDALGACDELVRTLDHLDRWAQEAGTNLLEAPEEVKRYRRAYLAQVHDQLQARLPAPGTAPAPGSS